MAKLDLVHGWAQVRDYLPKNYSALANEHKQVETKFGNAKIRDADTLLRYLLLHVGANLPGVHRAEHVAPHWTSAPEFTTCETPRKLQ